MINVHIEILEDDIDGTIIYNSGAVQMNVYNRVNFKDFVAKNVAVYMLLGTKYCDKRQIYIGQTKDIKRRLSEHDRMKDFWTTAIVFNVKDKILTRDDLEWLEKNLIFKFANSNMFDMVVNSQMPNDIQVSNMDYLSSTLDIFLLLLRIYGISFTRLYIKSNETPKQNSLAMRMTRQIINDNDQASPFINMVDEDVYEYDNGIIKGSYFELLDGRICLSKGSIIADNWDKNEERYKIISKYHIRLNNGSLDDDVICASEKELRKIIGI